MPAFRRRLTALPRSLWVVVLCYVVVGIGLWPVPLLNRLHVESAAVVAGVAFFAAGWAALASFRSGVVFGRVLAWQEAALLIPWLLLTVPVLWAPNCGYADGLLFFLLFPPVSVALAVALAYAISGTRIRRRHLAFTGVGLAVLVLTPLYDLGLHPQFYTYNHVFGGVLGPIYDEELTVRPGLLAFRGLTLLWAALAYLVGRRLRWRAGEAVSGGAGERESGRDGESGRGLLTTGHSDSSTPRFHISPIPQLIVVLLIGLVYVLAPVLGINTPAWYIQRVLDGHVQTAHFDIYYDPASLTADEVRVLAEDHEYRYAYLARRLDVPVPVRIASYLYPDPDTKARLTGARYTSVAPVWLRRPQVHVLLDAYGQVFPHELAHAFSREFGLPVLHASLAVGLVEGLAVALEPPDGLPTPHEQVAAAVAQRLGEAEEAPGLAQGLAARLSPLGFWTGRGAVSYTTMGSFVRYLLDAYGPARFKRVYATANFDEVYGKSVDVLAQEWQAYVFNLPAVDRAAGDLVRRRFSIPSLFEKPCPHYVPPYRRWHQEGVAALAAGDTARALARFEASLAQQPAYAAGLVSWAGVLLAQGQVEAVVARLDTLAVDHMTPALAVRLGHAQALLGHAAAARARYTWAMNHLPPFAHEQQILIALHRSLAMRPDVMQILTSSAPDDERAERLQAVPDAPPAARLLEALLWAAAGQYDAAADQLARRGVPVDTAWTAALQTQLQHVRLVWLAEARYRAGAWEEAEEAARRAARMYYAVGAFNEAARLQDVAQKLAWLRQQDGSLWSLSFLVMDQARQQMTMNDASAAS